MINVQVAVVDNHVAALMAAWVARTGKTLGDALETAARSACEALMQYTFPRENIKMESRVEGDARTPYVRPWMVYKDIPDKKTAAAYWKNIQDKKWARARAISSKNSPAFGSLPYEVFDGGAAHQAARGAKGYVKRGTRPVMIVKQTGKKNLLDRYVDAQQKRVGMAKAGWYHCWKLLGNAKGAPKWVTRHRGNELGEVTKQLTGDNRFVLIHNRVRYAEPAMDRAYRSYIEMEISDRLVKYFKRQLRLQ